MIMKSVFYSGVLLIIFFGCIKEYSGFEKIYLLEDGSESSGSNSGIKIYYENPWYWEYNGKPIMLIGGSYEDNMYQFPNWYYGHSNPNLSLGMTNWTLEEHLDKMVEVGANYIRASMSCRNHGNRFPYKKITGTPGDNHNHTDIYDLDQWDEVWEQRLSTFLQMCYERGIIVSIEFFDRWDMMQPGSAHWDAYNRGILNTGWEHHPWNPDRNINYTEAESGVDPTHRTNTWSHSFWYCVPYLDNDPQQPAQMKGGGIFLDYLHAYVDKILSYSFQYDNIIYIIENETYDPLPFGSYWVDYIKQKGIAAGKEIYVSNMVGNPEPDHERQQEVRRGAKYQFFDYSQNTHNTGQDHYDNIITARNDIANPGTETPIKPINNVKLYGATQFGTVTDAKERFWRGIFAGLASVRFHRPNYNGYIHGLGLNEDAQTQIKSVTMLQEEMNIFSCEPDNSLLGNRSDNEAYCLTEAGKQYAVYFTHGGSVTLDMSGASGRFFMRWLKIDESKWGTTTTIEGGGSQTLTAPSSGQWAVLITKQ